MALKAKQSYQNIRRPNTGQMNTAHIPYSLCTVSNKWKTFKIVEYNFIKQTSYLTLTKLSIAIYRKVPTKFSPHKKATYGELLQRKHISSYCAMIYGTFLFSKKFWTRWCPPNSRGMKLDPLPWSNEVQNTNNTNTTASRALSFYTETNRPYCNTRRKNSPYIQYIQRPSCVRNVSKTCILSNVKTSGII